MTDRATTKSKPYFALSTQQQQFMEHVRTWATKEVAPQARTIDTGIFPAEALHSAAIQGFMGINIPTMWGGLGFDHLCFALCIEEVAKACASTAVALDVHASVGSEPILLVGNDDQKQRFLPHLAQGQMLGAFALTEPESGSDAASLRTTAVREQDTYILNGSKIFITNAGYAGLYIVLASTNKQAGAKGITAFLVPADTPGLRTGPPQHKLGLCGSATAEVILQGCRVPVEYRLGDEGEGFRVAMLALDSGRIGISAQALGIAQHALTETIQILARYTTSGARVAQGLQYGLADMATAIEAARALTWQSARDCDAGVPVTSGAAMAKLLATDTAMAVTTQALDIAASLAPIDALETIERCFRDAKATQLYEGTNQIQRIVIARHMLGR